MKIISHRGFWFSDEEKNSSVAFVRSFESGFGTETDIRDYAGELVISHDPPQAGALKFAELLAIHAVHNPELPLALNIKSDGLQNELLDLTTVFKLVSFFFFDMSIPDALGYRRVGLPFYTRHSDIEPDPVLFAEAAGIWLDSFGPDWVTAEVIERHLKAGKAVCLVSPELHGRNHLPLWERLRVWPVSQDQGLTLCTDHPEEARRFFA
jgi:hypothetical protein